MILLPTKCYNKNKDCKIIYIKGMLNLFQGCLRSLALSLTPKRSPLIHYGSESIQTYADAIAHNNKFENV